MLTEYMDVDKSFAYKHILRGDSFKVSSCCHMLTEPYINLRLVPVVILSAAILQFRKGSNHVFLVKKIMSS